jgi:haloacetate dehalogenase
MSDLFPGFKSLSLPISTLVEPGAVFARVGGNGPPLLLLHGYPQTHVEWAPIAGALAARFTVVAMDLRGYGASAAPASQGGALYAKRLMAQDARAAMAALGFARFSVCGHDRGGRVAYRLALDAPEAVDKIAALDIAPTADMWAGMDAERAMQVYHWTFLAQPAPLPETLIAGAARAYLDHTLASWTKTKTLAPFSPDALAAYRDNFSRPERIHACCEDYRAGAALDRAADEADRAAGRKIAAPLLALWGGAGIPAKGRPLVEVWRGWARDVRGASLDCGHFLPEEDPDGTLKALFAFFDERA